MSIDFASLGVPAKPDTLKTTFAGRDTAPPRGAQD